MHLAYIKIYRSIPKSNIPKLIGFTLASCAILIPYMFLTGYPATSGHDVINTVKIASQRNAYQESLRLMHGDPSKQRSPPKTPVDPGQDESIPQNPRHSEHGYLHQRRHFAEHRHILAEKSNKPKQHESRNEKPDHTRRSGSPLKPPSGSNHPEQRVSVTKKHYNKGQHEISGRVELVPASPRLFGAGKTSEVRQVVFVKVHKAASSTMQSILLRFAMARNLSVLLPYSPKRTVLSETNPTINRGSIIPQPPGQPFDILCNHIIYDKQEIAKYIPLSAVRVAILRQPLKQALSALEYYTKYFPYAGVRDGVNRYKNDPINGFLQHPEQFYAWNTKWTTRHCFVNNRMSIDLGFDTRNFEESKRNKTKIREFIGSLENDFDLMLISDYFEESLVLLRRYLSWSWQDIIYVKLNMAKHAASSVWAQAPVLNASAQQAFHRWNIIDIELYDYFLPLFLKRIRSEHLFSDEVLAFKNVLKRLNTFCLDDTVNKSLKITTNGWTKEFTVSKSDCELMSMKEPAIVKMARTRQLERYETFMDGKKLKT